jgi:hypothetical protein
MPRRNCSPQNLRPPRPNRRLWQPFVFPGIGSLTTPLPVKSVWSIWPPLPVFPMITGLQANVLIVSGRWIGCRTLPWDADGFTNFESQ